MSLFNFNPPPKAKKFKPKQCPKCKSLELQLIEMWTDHSIVFIQDENGLTYEQGDLDAGYSKQVHAKCEKCGHGWVLRGARAIDDVALRVDAYNKPTERARRIWGLDTEGNA